MSRYLTVEEVAEALGVSASWVYKHTDLTTLLAQPGRGSARPATEDTDGGRPRQVSARSSWGLD
jgi:hypothetical protein